MVFADLFFIYVFLPLCLLSYFIARSLPAKNAVLIIFSVLFYAWGEPLWVILLLFSSFINWFMALQIEKSAARAALKPVWPSGPLSTSCCW